MSGETFEGIGESVNCIVFFFLLDFFFFFKHDDMTPDGDPTGALGDDGAVGVETKGGGGDMEAGGDVEREVCGGE